DNVVPPVGRLFPRVKDGEVGFQHVAEFHHAQYGTIFIFVGEQVPLFSQCFGIDGVLHHASVNQVRDGGNNHQRYHQRVATCGLGNQENDRKKCMNDAAQGSRHTSHRKISHV